MVGETEGLFFVVWSVLIIDGWVVMAWSMKSCLRPGKIACLVSLVLFKDRGSRVSRRFYFFVSDINQGNFLAWHQE